MPIYIQNTLSRKKEEFIPLLPPKVNIYSCGVTVYDESHIGHARSLYTFDVIRRYLAYRGFDVSFVRNITDIDDKIINRARDLGIRWDELVTGCIRSYYEDLKLLGIAKADYEPRATDNIPGMIDGISKLIENGFAYVTPTGVYFSVRSFQKYGKLSGQSIEEMQSGARIEPDENKKEPLDFALWKRSKPDEPSWPSPWGEGRPGWHIECSVMSMKYLKCDTLDVHAGGRDLVFPHHENEIAQSEALTGKPFAKYWVHHGLLTVNGQKMSKSLGNFVTIKDFLKKYRYPEILKLFFLSAHYSHPIDYSDAKIEEGKQALERIVILLEKSPGAAPGEISVFAELEAAKSGFLAAMDDDFNTPQALAAVFELVNLTNRRAEDPAFAAAAIVLLEELARLLGLDLSALAGQMRTAPEGEAKQVEEMVQRRLEAKKRRDFAEADRIRDELNRQGIVIEDTKLGTIWRKKL